MVVLNQTIWKSGLTYMSISQIGIVLWRLVSKKNKSANLWWWITYAQTPQYCLSNSQYSHIHELLVWSSKEMNWPLGNNFQDTNSLKLCNNLTCFLAMSRVVTNDQVAFVYGTISGDWFCWGLIICSFLNCFLLVHFPLDSQFFI